MKISYPVDTPISLSYKKYHNVCFQTAISQKTGFCCLRKDNL